MLAKKMMRIYLIKKTSLDTRRLLDDYHMPTLSSEYYER